MHWQPEEKTGTGSLLFLYRNRRERAYMEQEMEILQGAVSAVVYQNYENGYSVLRLNVGGGQMVTVVGTIPLPAVGAF